MGNSFFPDCAFSYHRLRPQVPLVDQCYGYPASNLKQVPASKA